MPSDDVTKFSKKRIAKNIFVLCKLNRYIIFGDDLRTYNCEEWTVECKPSNIIRCAGWATKFFKYLSSKLRGLI